MSCTAAEPLLFKSGFHKFQSLHYLYTQKLTWPSCLQRDHQDFSLWCLLQVMREINISLCKHFTLKVTRTDTQPYLLLILHPELSIFTMSSKVHSHHPAVDPVVYDVLQKTYRNHVNQILCCKTVGDQSTYTANLG